MDDLQKFIAAKVKTKLRDIFDPEIPVNIVDLGLIYNVEINKEMDCQVLMTLTAPNCPAAEILPAECMLMHRVWMVYKKSMSTLHLILLGHLIVYQKKQNLH